MCPLNSWNVLPYRSVFVYLGALEYTRRVYANNVISGGDLGPRGILSGGAPEGLDSEVSHVCVTNAQEKPGHARPW